MTRKDYVAIAAVIHGEISCHANNAEVSLCARNIALSLADVMRRDNPRFDRTKFYTACGFDKLRDDLKPASYVNAN